MPAENNFEGNSLTPEDIKKLTSDLSSEIDQEIKKQLSQPHPFSDTQEKIDLTLKQAEEAKEELKNQKQDLSNGQENKEGKEPSEGPINLAPVQQTVVSQKETNQSLASDPLTASINAALENLKENDKIGGDWVLKKIYSTSFGHNRSFFYELENSAGAKWTLNQEEMKDLLKKNVTGKSQQVDLSPQKEETSEKEEKVVIEKNILGTKDLKIENESKDTPSEKAEEDKAKEESVKEAGTLTKEQVELLSKLHSEPSLWQAFTSFSPNQLAKVNSLYQEGKLIEIGIDAHPLLDRFKTEKSGKEIEIGKNDNFDSIAKKENLQLTYTNTDAPIFALHILANEKLLKETIKKAEGAGLVVPNLPEGAEIIKITKAALAGDNQAFDTLAQFLKILPVNSKFRVLKTAEIDDLKKYIVNQ